MKHLLALIVIALGFQIAPLHAEGIADPLPVPAGASATEAAALDRRRAALLAEERAISAEVERHDAQCSSIDANNTSLMQRCEARQSQILARVDAYRRAVDAYNKDVRDLEQRQASSPGRQTAISVPMGRAVGAVKVSNGGVAVSAPAGQSVSFDRVETGPRSSFSFDLPNRAEFVVGANTALVLDAVERSQELWRKGEEVVLHLNRASKGSFRSQAILAGYVGVRYRIRTSTVIAGVRGTDFIFEIDNDGASKWRLFKGELEISSAKSSPVLLKPGQQVAARGDGTIGPVTAFDADRAAQAWEQSLTGP